jgi:hypothetical protein
LAEIGERLGAVDSQIKNTNERPSVAFLEWLQPITSEPLGARNDYACWRSRRLQQAAYSILPRHAR